MSFLSMCVCFSAVGSCGDLRGNGAEKKGSGKAN